MACHLLDNLAFMRWFGMSQVRDDDGCPLVAYHGTTMQEQWCVWDRKAAAQYKPKKCLDMVGMWFSDSHELGRVFSGDKGRVEAVYLKIEFPFIITSKSQFDLLVDAADAWPREGRKVARGKMFGIDHDKLRRWLRESGNDGLWFRDAHLFWDNFNLASRYDYWVALEPTQIKSVNNRGTYHPQRKSYLDGI